MSDTHEAIAARLRDAYTAGAVPPLRDGLSPTDVAGAYAVQSINTRFWQAEGRRVIGRKVGLTAKAVQTQLGVDQPDFGALFADMLIADGDILDPARVLQPKVEAEVALVMARDVDNPEAGFADILSAVAYALPAIEVVDSRIADWKITFADTVADNASSAFFVLGTEPRLLTGLDLRTCGMVMEIDGAIVSMGVGAACLGHPLNAAAWLAATLARNGDRLRAGDVVMTGALGPMAPLTVGCGVRATIGGLGSVGFRYGGSGA
ncbi:MAG: 2-keto-4-pentenoate hydratase [Sphingomonadales bacterium]